MMKQNLVQNGTYQELNKNVRKDIYFFIFIIIINNKSFNKSKYG